MNYVRCHDDIGWTFSDEDAAALDINGFDHRQFLNDFYTGRFKGSFAQGLPFQFNPRPGIPAFRAPAPPWLAWKRPCRSETDAQVELAIRRILLMHSVILSIGGIPLLYLGDEIGTLNDYDYRQDPARADDSRWVHRPRADWRAFARRSDVDTIEGRVFSRLRHLIACVKRHPPLAATRPRSSTLGILTSLDYVRRYAGQRVLVLASFSERKQPVAANELRLHGLSHDFSDLVTGEQVSTRSDLVLEPLSFAWLEAN